MPTSRRIGYFTNQYPAVSHSFIRREILALESLGWQVSRFAIRSHPGGVADAADIAEAELTKFITKTPFGELLGIFLRQMLFNAPRFFRTLCYSFWFNWRYSKSLLKTLICLLEACVLSAWANKEDIKHLHVHFGTNATTIALFAQRLGGPGYSFTVHGPEEFDKPETLGLNEKIHQAGFVVAISSFGKSQLYRWADFADWGKIKVVHCGLADDFLQAESTDVPDAPRLVCVGRLSEQKGQMVLLQAAARLQAEALAFKLVLVGDGPLRADIERFIAEQGLTEQVELTGSLSGEQVREQMARARAFVLPSFAEGLPVVIMEAFAMRRPVISSYVAGIPELVENGVNGWLVPAGAVDGLARAMQEALQASPNMLMKMGEAGYAAVQARHAIATEAAKLSDLFADALLDRADKAL